MREENKLRYLRTAMPDVPGPTFSAPERDVRPLGHERAGEQDVEFISIPEWCRRVGCAPDSGYRAARRGEIPGMFRIGRLMRVNWPAFLDATARSGRSSGPASSERSVE